MAESIQIEVIFSVLDRVRATSNQKVQEEKPTMKNLHLFMNVH